MSRYDDEHFLLWFTRPTPTWLELSAEARGVAISVAMVLNPKTGQLMLRKGLSSLAILVRIPWEKLEPALAELIAANKLAWDGSNFVLSDPEHHDRKRKTSTERVNEHRARKKTQSSLPPASGPEQSPSIPPPACNGETVSPVSPSSCNAETVALISSNLVSSGSGSENARATGRPKWFDDACDTIEFQVGETIDRVAAWIRYEGARTSPGATKAMCGPDARQWLVSVDVPMAKKAREEAARQRERDAKLDAERARRREGPANPAEPQKFTEDEQRRLAEQIPMRRRNREVA